MQTNNHLETLRLASLLLLAGAVACNDDTTAADTATETNGSETDGDGDGDGDTGDGDTGDGDGDSGDGDGDPGPVCGDGKVDEGEACDDGNEVDTDACTSTCELATCGDGLVQEGVEECDDGNMDSSDTCVEGCLNATCGDGFVGPGEGCDDGNSVDDDACNNACAPTSCGDGITQQGEACDDGNADNTDDCLDTCAAPTCGDGYVWAGNEVCDDGNADNTDDCLDACAPASCGDGYVWADNEQCDDGNADNTDDCLDTCATPTCGDGYVWADNEACDDGNADNTDDCLDTCAPASCGDGYVWVGNEACDDGNMVDADTCGNDCTLGDGAIKIARGMHTTCALTANGQVKCWGYGGQGALGQGDNMNIGDDELPSSIGFIELGGIAVDVEAGGWHVCALMDDASVMCWGYNLSGQLGYGHVAYIGDNELPSSAGPVDVGDDVVAIALGGHHTCVLTDQQTVRCWGSNSNGELGRGSTVQIGDDELPSSFGPISVGGPVVDIAVGFHHACARLDSGGVKCWGINSFGQLGQGHTNSIGDNEFPSSVGVVSLGDTPVVDVFATGAHTCALYEDGTMRCWGYAAYGQLGQGNTNHIGDDELPSSVPTIDVGAAVDEVSVGYHNTCARIGTEVKCWGYGTGGTNGYGSTAHLGDDELPSSYGMVDVGFDVTALGTGGLGYHICALSGSALRCWGLATHGPLGYGNTDWIGDDELPSSVGEVSYL